MYAYYDYFAERKVGEEALVKMAKAMGVSDAASGKDFVAALDLLIKEVGCDGLCMSKEGISKEELALYPKKIHEVIGGDITADPLPLEDKDYLEIFKAAYR